jgi:DNA (cytosine-5)-methyltransferase 1
MLMYNRKRSRAYYNEIDKNAAAWLRELIRQGHLPEGDVDERDIRDVGPADLRGFDQCHFFAGIGGWALALKRAGWPDDKPVWTGSCPCQPFSGAGKRGGFDDERHLWPAWHWLIGQCEPQTILGEQVASKDGLAWLDLVQADLEGTDYASAAFDICAAGVGAPHIRQRLWFVAERMADTNGRHTSAEREQRSGEQRQQPQDGGVGGVADTEGSGRRKERANIGRGTVGDRSEGLSAGLGASGGDHRPGPTNGLWRDADWLLCRDGKWRPVEPGSLPLAHGLPARVGQLRGYGNAINVEVATTFIKSVMDIQ